MGGNEWLMGRNAGQSPKPVEYLAMRWDIFCKVIDNHGDLGVCWRLARALAADGDAVRLWVDDPSALAWMAPEGAAGVRLIHWQAPGTTLDPALLCEPAPDVLVEAFGCDPAPELLAHFAQAARAGAQAAQAPTRHWINLEYLSAEPQIERLHGLPSPVFSGPGAGLTKHFFYPGFTPATGGLLRERDLTMRQQQVARDLWLRAQGLPSQRVCLVSLFCYEPPALGPLLAALPREAPGAHLLITPGRASAAVRAAAGSASLPAHSFLPYLAQPDYDALLWSCALNFVRGEDSLVRALWAGQPLVWQIYPQHDGAHQEKLEAFLDWLQAPASLRTFHRVWNGFSDAPLRFPDASTLGEWGENTRTARARLLEQDDLVTQLRRFLRRKS